MKLVAIKIDGKYFKEFTYPENAKSSYAGWGGGSVIEQKGIELTDEKHEFTTLSAGNLAKEILYLMRNDQIPTADIVLEVRDDKKEVKK
jgi:hypothetical protein